jgi:hypothetical protein
VFADPADEIEIGALEEQLQARLDRVRHPVPGVRLSAQARAELRRRPVALGDVFAASVDRARLLDTAGTVEVPPPSWLDAPVYDITADAREAARQVFYAAVTAPLRASTRAEIKRQLKGREA